MKKNKLMKIFLLVTLLLNTVLPVFATTVSASEIKNNDQSKAGTGTISAVFFEDLNNNNQQDPSEPGVAGIEVTLFDATTNNKLDTTTTDSSGRYTFSNLPAGYYYLKLGEVPKGYKWFGQGSIGFGGGSTRYFPLAEGQTESGAYLTLYPTTASMKGIAYSDKNKNGQKDSDEVGIAGLETSIFKVGSSTPVQTTTTDGQGAYHFSKLEPTTPYSVEIKFPSDYEVTSKSYFIESGKSEAISLSEEQMLENVNLGLYKAVPVGSISVNPTVLEKFVGEGGTLVTTVLPVDATDKSVMYSSGDTTVMTVDSNGNWVAKKAGTTTIKVTSNEDKSKFAYVTVTVKEKYNSTISGQIQKEDGSGFSGIHVELREPGSDKLIQQMTTSTAGNYSFERLTTVDYYIQVTIPKEYQLKYGYKFFDSTGKSVYLTPNGTNPISGVNLQLEPKQILPDSIKVSPKVIDTIVNETGQLTVDFLPTNTTNKDLVYRVSDISILSVDANGKWTAKKSGKATITVVSASGAQDTVEVTVRSFTNSHIAGKIVDPNGKPVSGVDLVIYSWDGKLIGQKTTDATGTYRFDSLEAMDYYLAINVSENHKFISSNYFWGGYTGYLKVDGTNSIDNVDAVVKLVNQKSSAIGGKIIDSNSVPVSGVELSIYAWNGELVGQKTTDVTGTYRFDNLEEMDYYVAIKIPEDYSFVSSNHFWNGQTGYLKLDGSNSIDNVDMTVKLAKDSVLSGMIYDQTDPIVGLGNVKIQLINTATGQITQTTTDAYGKYTFKNLSKAIYYIQVTIPKDYKVEYGYNQFDEIGRSVYFQLNGSNTISGINLQLLKK